MVDRALPGQILLGDFLTRPADGGRGEDTPCFVESAAATLDQLNGLEISGGRIAGIRCYVTGRDAGDGRYVVDRYHLQDKHGTVRAVYNAKINIHREAAEPIFLGIRTQDLAVFDASPAETGGSPR